VKLLKEKLKKYINIITYYLNYYSISLMFLTLLAVIFVLTIILVGTSEFESIGSALWWLIITLITTEPGYADVYPQTTLGFIIQLLTIILGVGIFGTFVAKILSVFSINIRKRELGEMTIHHRKHIIICGYSEKTDTIITQLLNEPNESKFYNNIVLVADIERNPYLDYNKVDFVKGPIDDKLTLKNAGIENANAVIILNEDNDDSTTALAALIIRALNKKVHLVAEASDAENKDYFINAGVDKVIINNDISSQLIVRTALYGNTSDIINELLNNEIGNEIYIGSIKEKDIGKNYLEIFEKYKSEKDISIIGVKEEYDEDSKVTLNPDKDYVIKPKDEIIYIGKNKKIGFYHKLLKKLI
jgi:voltage-gated potassium channel